MGTKNNPGKFDCIAAAHPDEPMFTLLGRDPMAGALVRQWADMRAAAGEDPAKVKEARDCADALDAWTEKQGTLSVQVTDPSASGRQWVVTVEAATKGGLVVPSTIHMNSGDRPASREEWKLFKSLVDRAWAEFDQAAAEAKARMR